MLVFSEKKTKPFIIHAAGKPIFNPYWPAMIDLISFAKEVQDDPRIHVMTCLFKDEKRENEYKKVDQTLMFLERIKMKHTVLESCKSSWSNRDKIKIFYDHIKTVKSEFVLALDCADVAVFNFPNPRILTDLACDMIFGAERNFWPEGWNEQKTKEDQLSPGQTFKYLNSGMWFSKTEYAKQALECMASQVDSELLQYQSSDQVLFKNFYVKNYPAVKIDSECRVFANICHVRKEDGIFSCKKRFA